jgi:hypothetical protein
VNDSAAPAPPLPITVDVDAVNRYVAEAIIGSVLGEKIREAVDKTLEDLVKPTGTFRSGDSAVAQIVREAAYQALRERLGEPEVVAVFKKAMDEYWTPEKVAGIAASMEISFRKGY